MKTITDTYKTRKTDAVKTRNNVTGLLWKNATHLLVAGLLLISPIAPTAHAGDQIDQYLDLFNTITGDSFTKDNLVSIDPATISIATTTENGGLYYLGRDQNFAPDATLSYTSGSTGGELFSISDNIFDPAYISQADIANGYFIPFTEPLEAGANLTFTYTEEGGWFSPETVYTSISDALAYAIADSPYLLLGFETGFGNQHDDLVLAINIGTPMTTAPEPSTILILGSFLLLVIYLRNRQQVTTEKNVHS